ncbi:MAG: hypothetical protein JNK73_01505 [Bacteroidia bacterium]|nr:hypothetical protein [Bacteroidia bacterium]
MKFNSTLRILAFSLLIGVNQNSTAQDLEGKFLKDSKSGCTVWFKHTFSEDSVYWTGGCKDGFANGKGTMLGYTKGKRTSIYKGEMKHGKPNGYGAFSFWGDRSLKGNFRDGEPLFLSPGLLKKLSRTVISDNDSTNIYVGDNNRKELYYDALIPDGEIRGTIILLPGTWSSTEYNLSSTSSICELAIKNHLAVLVFSINQRLTLIDPVLDLMNAMISSAIKKYKLPENKFVLGGWSMGGIFSLRYAEFANQDSTKTVIVPRAVFNCDGPCDLANIYNNFKRKLSKNPGQNEPAYGTKELEKYCKGTPDSPGNLYNYYSPYSHHLNDGGNAKYLIHTPIRIYADVDPVWWMKNRDVDAYDLNALDQTAMIQKLNDMGNKKAEFINNYQKGYRIEGNRHPHSWSIVEPIDFINWVLKCIE